MQLVALLFTFSLVAAACGGDDGGGEYGLVSDGELTVCTDVPYPPMEFEDPTAEGGYSGFDIELMRAIADDLGLGLAVATPGWDAITSGLATETGVCDISAASITITAEREENIDFSEPYFVAEQSLLVAADSAFTTLSELGSVAVQSGTTGEVYLNDNAPEGVEVISYEGIADLYLALEAGEVDGVVTDLVGNQGYVDDTGGAKVIESYATDEVYGFAVQEEGSEDLLAAVNESLAKLRSNDTYDTIFGQFFSGS
jgi:polar amino acid transport system substrate-binding protein